jgi:histidine triad (HIT) family protein
MACIFCEIVAGRAPASVIYQDDVLMAFMGIQPTAPGECLVIPRTHIDHFTDVSDEAAQRIIVVAQRIGRAMRALFEPERVGYLVHGYGVAHAHLVLVPQHGPHHLTSDRCARVEDGRVVFDLSLIPFADRATLDEQAHALASAIAAPADGAPGAAQANCPGGKLRPSAISP